jgi:hypothetical protein
VHVPAERHPVRFLVKGRDDSGDELVFGDHRQPRRSSVVPSAVPR